MKVAVIGGREFDDYERLKRVLDKAQALKKTTLIIYF